MSNGNNLVADYHNIVIEICFLLHCLKVTIRVVNTAYISIFKIANN